MQVSVTEIFQLMNNDAWDWDLEKPKTYGLKYYTESGELRIRYNCRKNVKNIHHLKQRGESTHSERGKWDRAIKGLVQIYDEDTQEHRAIQAAQIVYFRNHGETKWIPIKN
jgi:hypothetical protein